MHSPEVLWSFCPAGLVARVKLVAEVIQHRVKGDDYLPARLDAVYPRPKYLARVGYVPDGRQSRGQDFK